jgi:hypothetical protein
MWPEHGQKEKISHRQNGEYEQQPGPAAAVSVF